MSYWTEEYIHPRIAKLLASFAIPAVLAFVASMLSYIPLVLGMIGAAIAFGIGVYLRVVEAKQP